MKQSVRVIKKQRDYDAALSRLSDLMSTDFAAGSDEEAELELLALVIEAYEADKVAPVIPDPIEAILFRLDQQKLSTKDLVPLIGSISKVSEVLSRKRPLSLAMIRALHKGLGIPAEILISASGEEGFDVEAPQYNFSKFPLTEMFDRGCFSDFDINVKNLKDYAEEVVTKFMRGIWTTNQSPALLRAPLYQSGSREMNEYALIAWRICVLKKARNMSIKQKFEKDIINEDWMRDLVKLSRFDTGPKLAQGHLRDSGIALVIEPHFKKTYLDGAAMLDEGRPIVALTLRHDRIDNFWFALLHELQHIRMHLGTSHIFIADNLEDKTRNSKEEEEADAGAREALIPAAIWHTSQVRTSHTLADAVALASQLRIHPAIVAGKLRHETSNWRLLTNITGAEVKSNFLDQLTS
ncbi:ImmA/IrrE family metallo-endopeptidase [Methyloradius palustris]|uniref:Transcriptional regulator n=1 Tax=Methyloradius palustris TaxID=2778876 RepID=A0A8D5JXB4_9PROT|nr:ImmA/IrrE family metallo-endopeptidase [Methyloradius palustris]BCM25964.1 hypothetical protein ZMTM_22230 [Methyloradius palustris]